MHTKKAIVIGSGVAGMAVATRLAVQGFSVTVYEKNSYPGGKLSAFEQDGYHFDAGPSLFTQPQNLHALFELAGEPMEQYFSYQPMPVACKYFYPNGKIVQAFTEVANFEKELQQQLNEQPGVLTSYLQQSEKLYNRIGNIFLNHSLHKRKTWLHKRVAKALAAVKPGYLFSSLNSHNQRKFKSPEAVQLFNRFATYNGSNPYKAPGMLSLIPHLEQNMGTFYPKAGMISITNALHQLALKKGVTFVFNSPVQRIIHHEGAVKGVVVNQQNIEADIVVSNLDVYFTQQQLLLNQRKANKIARQERSSSAVIFYWGINQSFPEVQLHNIFFSNNYKEEFNAIFKQKQLFADPTIYINITSKAEQGMAPAGKENWFVMVNVPADTGQNWAAEKEKLKIIITDKLSRLLQKNISACIETEATLDPQLIQEKTGSYMGALYGTSSNSKMAAFLRHPNFTSLIKGLYFCGGSAHPGGGIPLCLKSAQIVSNLVAADSKNKRH
jgi:phytoene desaturase